MKQKANGTKRARITAHGFEQVDGVHFDSTSTSAPVTNEVTIRVILILAVMAEFDMQLIDVRGAFLNRRFQSGEKVYYTTGCNGIYRIDEEQSIFLSVLQMDPRRTWVLVIMG